MTRFSGITHWRDAAELLDQIPNELLIYMEDRVLARLDPGKPGCDAQEAATEWLAKMMGDNIVGDCGNILASYCTAEDRAAQAPLAAAAVLAAECSLRVRVVLEEPFSGRGWDTYPVALGMGIAVGLGLLHGATPGQLASALSIVSTLGTGLRGGSHPLRRVRIHWAALDAYEAVALALAGFKAPPDGVGGRRGLLAVMAPGVDASRLTEGLGRVWLLRAHLV